MTYTVKSNGQPTGTRIFHDDKDITKYVTKVEWVHDGGDNIPKLVLTVAFAHATLTGRARFVTLDGRPIKSIVFTDDTEFTSSVE